MSKMCHAVESEEATMDGDNNVLTCSDSGWYKCGHGVDSSVTNGELEWLSMQTSPCGTLYSTPCRTPRFSRGSSSSSFASCFSSFVDSLIYTDSEEESETPDTGQLNPDIFVSDEFMEQGKGNLIKEEECQLSHTTVFSGGADIPIPADQNILSSQMQLETDQGATKESFDACNVILDTNVSLEPDRKTLSNDQLTGTQYGEEVTSLPMPGGEIVPLKGAGSILPEEDKGRT